tara:strand:- start:144 stop:290 length:147 start_codon:yes stop_codon:yes gene_type:complete
MKAVELLNMLEESELLKLADEHPQDLLDICSMISLDSQLEKENLETIN